jgi:hypothetical protein
MPIASASTTDIISAAVGVIGLIIGAIGLVAARNARKEATRLREREQAGKISAWARKRTDEGRVVIAMNASDSPVRNVRVWLVTPSTPAPDDGVPDRDPTAQRAVLEPDAPLEHEIPSSAMRGSAPAERPSVVLAFRDADGRDWIRAANGVLSRT